MDVLLWVISGAALVVSLAALGVAIKNSRR